MRTRPNTAGRALPAHSVDCDLSPYQDPSRRLRGSKTWVRAETYTGRTPRQMYFFPDASRPAHSQTSAATMASDERERGARFEKTAIRAKRSLQELLEVAGGHPVAFDLQLVVGVARAIDAVRRISENEVNGIRAHQPRDIGPTVRIAGEECSLSQ